ncbi:tetratricopeptide repeat-containing sensor histidine kinase [Hymenobacter sp. 102]|uniref:sensor histidine kinase n=1 Tax=Hymenobacter sp. 102 TaxID=3403152 RepID=UPI003CFA2334
MFLLWAVGKSRATPPSGLLGPEELPAVEAHRVIRQMTRQLPAALQRQDTAQIRQLHWWVGRAWGGLNRPEKAAWHYRKALGLSQDGSEASAWLEWLLGRALLSQGDTGQARQAYRLAYSIFQRRRHVRGQGQVLEQLGDLFGRMGHWNQAQKSYEQALAAWQLTHDKARAAHALNLLGTAHREQRHYFRAQYYLQKSLSWAQQQPDSALVSEALTGIGSVHQSLRNAEAAAPYFKRALQTLPHHAPPHKRAAALASLGIAYDSLGNAALAVQYFRTALQPARQAGSYVLLSQLYNSLSKLYRGQGQWQEALAALARYTELQDSAYAEQHLAQVAELQTRFETEKKEKEIQLLTKERQLQQAHLRRQTVVRNLLLLGTALLLLMVVVLYRAQRRQQHTNRLLRQKNTAINRQKEELDRLNRTKDTLFSIISHDLRGPLTSLHSLLALLKLGRLPADRLASHSERLTRMLDGTLHLLDNLLNWSAAQLKSGGSVRPERIRLEELVQETVALFQGDAERKGIRLRSETPDWCPALADINMVRLVLRNLLSNALKFTQPGGQVHISLMARTNCWEITVQDTGVGIDAAGQARLAEPSNYFSTPGTAREKGTGLGLPLCREFVHRNGGEFWFRSQWGAGSSFHFTLPIMPGETDSFKPDQLAYISAAAE